MLALFVLVLVVHPQAPLLSTGSAAPAINLTSDTGQRVNALAAAAHHALVIEFFDIECATCQRQAPALCGIAAGHTSDVVVAVDAGNESAAAIRGFRMRYFAAPCPITVLVDPGLAVSRAYRAAVVPTVYVVDKGGNIAYADVGPAGVDNLDAVLQRVGG